MDQQREAAAMVQVGMRQDNRIELGRPDRRKLGVASARVTTALKHPIIDQDAGAGRLEEVARSCHLSCRAVEG
jgi:hypothetical protein